MRLIIEKVTTLSAMKLVHSLCLAAFCLSLSPAGAVDPTALTNSNSLNDLVRRIPVYTRADDLRSLSAIQEILVRHEREMRGDGLPEPIATAFSVYYSSVISALIDERITEDYGRDLLSVHRQLLCRARNWYDRRVRDEAFGREVVENLRFFVRELDRNAAPLDEVPQSVVTPVVNGYQIWVGELLAWGSECDGLDPGQLRRIQHNLSELERFEFYYKRDGILNYRERELLHERFINVTRETIYEVRDSPLRAPAYSAQRRFGHFTARL